MSGQAAPSGERAISSPGLAPASSNPIDQIQFLLERTRLLEAVVDNFPGGIAVYDANLQMVLCNEQQKRLLDYPESLFENGYPSLEDTFRLNALRGEYGPGNPEEQVRLRMELAREQASHTFERTRPNGTVLEVRGVPLAGGGFVTTYVDVTDQRKTQATIAHMAHHDSLTDLPNRLLFRDRLEQALARVRRGERIGLHYVDLDRFKPVNDEHGHAVGDGLLKEVALRLNASKREMDTAARIGGDEFVVIQASMKLPSDAELMARRLVDRLSRPFDVEGRVLSIGASVGVALAPDHGNDAETLIRNADAALYQCKVAGRGTYAVHR